MKQVSIAILALVLVLILSACGGGVYQVSYTARGDGTEILSLTQTDQFQATDDLNVVVKFKSHNDPVEVSVKFLNPEGNQEGETLRATADREVGSVVLGLDWDARPEAEEWATGTWYAEVSVDGEQEARLRFRVN